MANTTSIVVNGGCSGMAEGQIQINYNLANAAAPGRATNVNTGAASALAALTIPASTAFILICPPAGNTVNLLVGGLAGDTAATLHPTNPTLLSVPSTSPRVFIGSVTTIVSNVQVYFL